MPTLEYRVKLKNANDASDNVTFVVSPDLMEARSVNYKTVDPVHAPGQIYAFVNSSSRTFNLSGVKLVSRTQEEAQNNLIHLWRLRAWTLPAFGKDPITPDQRDNREVLEDQARRTPTDPAKIGRRRRLLEEKHGGFGTDLRGSPPNVLLLSAYAHTGHLGQAVGHINNVPVVITSLNIPYPSDVDYFPTTQGVPMPTLMTIDITLAETHSPKEYENFSLTDFKAGILRGF